MDQDDLLFPDALFYVVYQLNGYLADVIYSEETKFNSKKREIEPTNKRDFSFKPLLLAHFLGHLTVIRRNLLSSSESLFTPGFDFAQDYELALRITQKTDKIIHIRKCLYAWRIHEGSTSDLPEQKPEIYISSKKAIERTLSKQKINASVVDGEFLGQYKVKVKDVYLDPTKTINFILPGIGQGGGARVVFQVANKLKMLGFDVNIIFPKTPYSFSDWP